MECLDVPGMMWENIGERLFSHTVGHVRKARNNKRVEIVSMTMYAVQTSRSAHKGFFINDYIGLAGQKLNLIGREGGAFMNNLIWSGRLQ